MRTLLPLAALLLLPSVASAQRDAPLQSWYQLRSGERTEMVQARAIDMRHGKEATEVRIDGRQMAFDGPVALAFMGTGPEPTTRGGRSGSGSASGDGGGASQHTEVEVIIDFDGTSTTKTTTTTQDHETGQTTTTTTTTTTTSDGETTSTTTTQPQR